jgi:hypothetical protein
MQKALKRLKALLAYPRKPTPLSQKSSQYHTTCALMAVITWRTENPPR